MTKDNAGLDERRNEAPEGDDELPPDSGKPRDEDLGRVVDDIEHRVTQERRDENAPGNVDDRKEQPPVDTGDDAPE